MRHSLNYIGEYYGDIESIWGYMYIYIYSVQALGVLPWELLIGG